MVDLDPDYDELKELLQKNLQLAAENNKLLRSIHRGTWLGVLFKFVYWGIILVALYFSYTYLEPYLKNLQQALQTLQSVSGQSQQNANQVQSFLQNPQNFVQQYLQQKPQ